LQPNRQSSKKVFDAPHMKRKTNIRGFILRSVAATLLSCLVLVALSFSGKAASSSGQAKTLGFAERVAYQRAIEEVYWRHRIWPEEGAHPKTVTQRRDVSGAARKESRRLPAQIASAGGLLATAA
jgi:hypothetical protein